MVVHKREAEEANENENAHRVDSIASANLELAFSNTKIDVILNPGDEMNMPDQEQ